MMLSKTLQKHGLTERNIFIWLFAPYRKTDEGLVSEYDDPATRAEMAAVFQALGLEWQWTPVTLENLRETVEKVKKSASERLPIVFNYCDGDDANGLPGISVPQILEENDIAFTGASSEFYHVSTSKLRLKQAFERAGVPVAPYAFIADPAHDVPGTCERLGAPLFVKPVISGGSMGLTWQSVVYNDAELLAQVEKLFEGMHEHEFREGGVLAEPFIKGTEFTVLVAGSAHFPEQKMVYPALEIVFDERLSEEKQHFVYDMWFEDLYSKKLADPVLWPLLGETAWKAFCAADGTGYGRVDMRMDGRTGEVFVLEVNANCAISSPENDNSSSATILKLSGAPFSQLVGQILSDALDRHFY